jgi:uridylate kinase
MMNGGYRETFIIKLGGSLIVPSEGIATTYLQQFQHFIRKQVAEHQRRFFIFVGGGLVARQYRDAGRAIVGHELPNEDLDWLGIHATRLNAHLLRTVFRDLAHPVIIKDYSIIQKPEKPVVIAAGWKPGWSTDYPAVILA